MQKQYIVTFPSTGFVVKISCYVKQLLSLHSSCFHVPV